MKWNVLCLATLFIFLLSQLTTFSQPQKEYLDINNVSMVVHSDGTLAQDTFSNQSSPSGYGSYFIPKPDSTSTIFAMRTWTMGKNAVTGKCAGDANTYSSWSWTIPNDTIGSSFGPVANNYDNAWKNRYAHVWKLNKSDIDYHKNNFNVLGYNMLDAIKNWPANGDTSNGEGFYLAPYIDWNVNGKYDPENGDFPCIKGDQAIYMIANSDRGSKGWARWSHPIEYHLMAYSFNSVSGLENTVFLDYKIINRSDTALDSVYVGFWTDFDLGCSNDDYIGCDSVLGVQYVYNGDQYDETCNGIHGYDTVLPFSGIVYLNQKMQSFMSYNRGTDPRTGDAFLCEHYYNYLRGIWKDSAHVVVGGNGHPSDTNATSVKTKYMYPADPRDTVEWNELTTGYPPFDRRGIGSTGPYIMNPGESVELELAIVTSFDNTLPVSRYLDVFDTFKQDVAFVRNFYNNNWRYCPHFATATNEIVGDDEIYIYPNPASNQLIVEVPDKVIGSFIEFYDTRGRFIERFKAESRNDIDVSTWNKGLYLLRIVNGNSLENRKILIR